MEKLHEAGKARAIGVSNFSCRKLEALLAAAAAKPRPSTRSSATVPPGLAEQRVQDCRSAGVHLSVFCSDPLLIPLSYREKKAGYRHIDCAAAYRNEKEVGLALKFFLRMVWLSEKICLSPLNCGPLIMHLKMCQRQSIHGPFRIKKGTMMSPENLIPTDIPATWGAMEKLYDSGKARAIGVSNFSCKKLDDLFAIARVPPAVNQVECHPVWQQDKLHKLCQSKGVHLSAFSPLGSPGSQVVNGPSVINNPIVVSVAEKLQKTPAQVTLRWGIQMGHSVLPKSANEARIKENISIFDWSIPEDLMAKFSEIKQVRLLRAEFAVHPQSGYNTLEDIWDGEI
ncbi:unnamed protein product [Urochloa decumbens]|uniref:NADP-dependent oxidoreductase domain-containing protein n=1 Tax=Urochloa decumbens TaxID=240449 RepID=A0ABC8VQ27_9POAL